MPSQGTGRQRRSIGMDPPTVVAEVLYLLNRGAQLEHPHMICVPYAGHQPGPTLREVKARLIALRGKGMPGLFSWSYKRNYKDSFIWCDLFDDDCILPLSATGEYVLKAMELFDASSPDEELEYQELRFRSSRVSSPGRSSRPSARPEHRHVENDVSVAIKKSLLLINSPGDSMDLNKQIMKNLSYSKRAPEICSFEHSDVSSSTATHNTTFEDGVTEARRKYSNPERHSPKGFSASKSERISSSPGTAHTKPSPPHLNEDQEQEKGQDKTRRDKEHPDRHSIGRVAAIAMSCNAGSQTTQLEAEQRDATTDCIELEPEDFLVQMSHSRTPSLAATKRRTWQNEIDKGTICTQLVYHKSSEDDLSSPLLEKDSNRSSGEDPFFFGMLRKATRLGISFRPRLCRGVDVVESTRSKTKLQFRSKSKHDVSENHGIKSPKSANPFMEEPPMSPAPVKDFMSLSEYFESQERQTPRSICKQIITSEEPIAPNVEELPSQQLCLAPESGSRDGALTLDPPPPVSEAAVAEAPIVRPQSRPFGNEALDASYRKTMEVLAKLPTSRGACRIHTLPHDSVQAAQKMTRSETKGNKQEVKADSRSSSKWSSAPASRTAVKEQDGAIPHDTGSRHSVESAPAKQRSRGSAKKGSAAGFEASTVSCRAKAVVKTSDEKPIKPARSGSRESSTNSKEQGNLTQDCTNAESFTFDSHVLHSGNKQGSKMAIQLITKGDGASAASPKSSAIEGATGWPFEQPVRPRDFKSREDRPLTPGLTSMDWEKSLQEAVMNSEPPVDLVLHECSQCGRTFKLESLQVHMRGCHGGNKPKSIIQRRVSL